MSAICPAAAAARASERLEDVVMGVALLYSCRVYSAVSFVRASNFQGLSLCGSCGEGFGVRVGALWFARESWEPVWRRASRGRIFL